MRRLGCLLVLVAVPLAGCSEEQADAAEIIRASPEAMAEAGTLRLSMTVEGPDGSFGSEAMVDFEAGEAQVTSDDSAVHPGTTTRVYTPETVYSESTVEGSDSWLAVDRDDAEDFGLDVDAALLDPTEIVDVLSTVTGDDPTEVGREEVDGTPATHFAAEVDLVTFRDRVESGEETSLTDEEVDALVQGLGEEPVSTDVWIDDDGRPRRLTVAFDAQGIALRMTIEMSAYGEPVDIQVPAGDDVVDVGEVLGDLPSND